MKKILLVIISILALSLVSIADTNKDYHLSNANITPRVLKLIDKNYVDKKLVDPKAMLKGALDQIQKNVAEILVIFDADGKFTITIDQAAKKFSYGKMENINDFWQALRDVYSYIDLHYHGTTDQKDIEYLAIEGMLNTLDPHSNILPPKIYTEFKIGTKGKFGGIGIVIGSKEGELTVISPIEGTPAWKAGIRANDKIIQIGEESTINMSLTEAVERLRGDVGTQVVITVERSGRPAPFSVTLKRAIINIDSIQSASIPVGDKTIGYIKIKSFQEDTDKEFTKQLLALKKLPGFSGLVLDLRNNPGGLLNQAVAIVDKFVKEGVIVSTIGSNTEEAYASGDTTEANYPLVVLINEGSASASEIVAGTLQYYARAVVVGNQSFGKGSVQTVYDLSDGSALKLTIAEYLTAGINSIQSVGVSPDIKMIPVRINKEEMNLAEDEFESEKSLEHHLGQTVQKPKDPKFKLSFLESTSKENEEEERRREYSTKIDFAKDFPASFAARLAANMNFEGEKETLNGMEGTIKSSQNGETDKIAAALSKLGVEWNGCTQSGKPQLSVSFSMQKNGQPVKHAVAGEDVNLILTAKNIGTGPFCRLIGNVNSKEPLLKNREFVFGNLEAAQTKSWTVPFKVPKSLVSQGLGLDVKFNEDNLNQPANFKAVVPVVGLPQPQFAYSFRLGTPATSKTPKNELPRDKLIPLILDVKNIGNGASDNAIAIIKNSDSKGIFIDTGRVKLGKIAPGETKQAVLKFMIEPAFDDTNFKLELTIMDPDLLTSLTEKVEFNTANSVTKPFAGQWYQGPKIELATKALPITTNSQNIHIEGTITDDQSVKDYFIFVGDEKVAYSSNPVTSTSYKISANLPLKEGNNIVSIGARDNQDMMSRYVFVVDRR